MTEKRILFDGFEFPIIKGLEYLINENLTETDFLLIHEPNSDFSLMFEKNFPIFEVPENLDRDYCLFELKRSDRVIKFFCPEKHKNLDSAVWYFCMELFDENGVVHALPGQVRVEFNGTYLRQVKGKPQFIEVLERVKLTSAAVSA